MFDAAQLNAQPIIRKAPMEKLLSITWGKILLQSWLAWSWIDGIVIEHARNDFATIGENPIEETLGYIFGSNISVVGESHRPLLEQSQVTKTLPFKFVDQLSLLLTPQEKLLAAVNYPFQPAVWKSWHGLFRKQERKAIPYSAFILTERQFLMIYEDADDTESSFGTYIQSVKRKNIIDLLIENKLDGPQLILLVSDKKADERIILPAPEECFDEMIERFRLYFRQ